MAVKHRVTPKKKTLSHWNASVLLPINSERAHTEVHTNLYHWLYSFQQIMLRYSLQLMPWATVWLLRRCLSTWCTEVRKADEQQELVKLLWQLEVWPSGTWSAPFHGLWFPPHSLWKVNTCLVGTHVSMRIQHFVTYWQMCHKPTLTSGSSPSF